ncbi:MAG: hypothetical protein ACR2MX_14525 [Cyclobacteriaceae bacterium]
MSRIGSYMAIFGAGSVILSFFNVEFRILMWIESWGPTVGWAIRIGLLVLGLVLIYAGRTKEAPESSSEQ